MIAASASGTGNTGLLGIFDAKGAELYRAENTGGQVNYVKWSPDGKTLAVAYESKTVRLLHVENGSVR
jgi:tricorn protease-like protein